MTDASDLSAETLRRLRTQAAHLGCSPDDLLNQLLDEQPVGHIPYRDILEKITDVVSLFDVELRHLYVNPVIEAITGFTQAEYIGKTNRDLGMPSDIVEQWDSVQREVLETGQERTVEFNFPAQDGQRYFELRYSPIFDVDGVVRYMLGVARDVTERKKAEIALIESEERYRSLIESSDAAISMVDYDGNYLFLNAIAAIPFGTTPDQLVGKTVHDLFRPEETASILRDVRRVIDSGQGITMETSVILNGVVRWFRTSVQPVRDSDGQSKKAMIHSTEITERKQAEIALSENEARYKHLTELMSDYAGEVVVHPDGSLELEWLEGAFEAITGHALDNDVEWAKLILVHPEDRARVQADLKRTAENNEVTISDYRIKHKSGKYRWIRAHRRPMWDDDEKRVVRFYSAVRDITAQKEAETSRLRQERLKALLQKERELNTLIQQSISSLSHDIRTPLSVIKTSRDLLTNYFDRMDEDKRREKLDMIDKQLQYVIQMMDDLSLAVKSGLNHRRFEPTAINITTLCRLSLEEVQSVSNYPLNLTLIDHTGGDIIEGDETLITRILLNLLSNAVKYSPPDGEVQLELDREDKWLIIRVADQGIGISPDDLPRVFEPFFRSDRPRVRAVGGTGLGLSIVKDCVDRHSGRIRVESKLDGGTTVTVWLPVH